MPGSPTQVRNRKRDAPSDKNTAYDDSPVSEIEPACSEDDDAAPKSLKPGGGDEAQLPADPLKDIKEGIHQAPCSMEFWVVMGTALLCFAAAKYLEFSPSTPNERVFTKEELKKYDGSAGDPIYLSILGQVFDVTNGKKYYGEKGGYGFFTGRDATRAFITGDFMNNLSDNISDFSAEQYKGLAEWRDFYKESKDYPFMGLLEGAFYDSKGRPTKALKQAEEGAILGAKVKELREIEKKKYPNCNSRWSQKKGGEIWCKEGYPRRIVETIPGAKPATRCACFKEMDYSDARRLYDDCEPDQQRCKTYKKSDKESEKPADHPTTSSTPISS